MNRPVLAFAATALLAAGPVAGCSGQAESADGQPPAAARPVAHPGDTLTLTRADGSNVVVTLDGVIRPATPTRSGAEPDTGYLATKFTITDPGPSEIEGSVNINVSVIGSDDQIHAADLKNVEECTNFDSGVFHLAPGESASGCVVFALPRGVDPVRVKYVPSAGFADDAGEWTID
ncbi:hypothetical protein MU0083_002257 [[Mycobacterium] kokjensenii]|uniref:DUF4352 domain-containing protein n=1 Tax=[Mycobacterium] kokjensenii TaxID=3064287 RepID=A0ABN9N6V9_9MYCO|nr:hypothetical protein [Mycolicibacter sp. MU0083]CAJ1499739.1 hypothetical protein MU0083_002257 [Mycolicibacter sp. MU0083]